MLAKKLRLSHRNFAQVKKTATNSPGPYFSALTCTNDLPFSRFAVVTSRKIDKKATVRNRLRRLIYATIPPGVVVGYDIIIFPRRSMINLKHAEVSTQINNFLSKISGGT